MSCVLLNPMTSSQSFAVFPVSFAGSTWSGALACSSDVKGDRVSPTLLTALPSLVCQLLVSLWNTVGAGAHGAVLRALLYLTSSLDPKVVSDIHMRMLPHF